MIILQRVNRRARNKIMFHHGGAHRYLHPPKPVGHPKKKRDQNRRDVVTACNRCLFGVLVLYP
jgi:hypothetical protein